MEQLIIAPTTYRIRLITGNMNKKVELHKITSIVSMFSELRGDYNDTELITMCKGSIYNINNKVCQKRYYMPSYILLFLLTTSLNLLMLKKRPSRMCANILYMSMIDIFKHDHDKITYNKVWIWLLNKRAALKRNIKKYNNMSHDDIIIRLCKTCVLHDCRYKARANNKFESIYGHQMYYDIPTQADYIKLIQAYMT